MFVHVLCISPFHAAYGSDDPNNGHTIYLDSHWGIGAAMRELVHGVDCPLNAAYMDTLTVFKSNTMPIKHKNSICVFEMDTGGSNPQIFASLLVQEHSQCWTLVFNCLLEGSSGIRMHIFDACLTLC